MGRWLAAALGDGDCLLLRAPCELDEVLGRHGTQRALGEASGLDRDTRLLAQLQSAHEGAQLHVPDRKSVV